MSFLEMGAESAFSFYFISRIFLVLLSFVALVFTGYKIKEGWGVVITILIYTFFFLYTNGLPWNYFR
jgi:hypothetical protein